MVENRAFTKMNYVAIWSFLLWWNFSSGFISLSKNNPCFRKRRNSERKTILSTFLERLTKVPSFFVGDASVTEEDILNIVGEKVDLPNPSYFTIGFIIIVAGVAALQFSLGDLATQVRSN